MKTTLIVISLIGAAVMSMAAFDFLKKPLLIESLESKTNSGAVIHNEIQWFSMGTEDVWMMNQSHDGANLPQNKWDRLAIVINKKSKTAQFFQLPSGPLEWSEDLIKQKISFKVSCFMCHSNGLRAIRPAGASFAEKMKAQVWNFKIKFYGRITEDPTYSETDPLAEFPFRHKAEFENDALNVKTCTMCHKESGFGARGTLTRQNSVAIKFMVDGGFMPPLGIPLLKSEKSKILKFTQGF